MSDQEVVEAHTPPQIEAEAMSEAEAKALREQNKAMSLDELHLFMSNVLRAARRGHLDRSRAGFLLWGGRQVKEIAEAVSERDDRLAYREYVAGLERQLQEIRNRPGADLSSLPYLSAPTEGDSLNGHASGDEISEALP